jgi:hypothetical protein
MNILIKIPISIINKWYIEVLIQQHLISTIWLKNLKIRKILRREKKKIMAL